MKLELTTREFIALYNELVVLGPISGSDGQQLSQVYLRMKAMIAEAIATNDEDAPIKRKKMDTWSQQQAEKIAELEKQNGVAKSAAADIVAKIVATTATPSNIVTLEDVPADAEGSREYPRRQPSMPRPGRNGQRRGR
jgi:hypothetical protein